MLYFMIVKTCFFQESPDGRPQDPFSTRVPARVRNNLIDVVFAIAKIRRCTALQLFLNHLQVASNEINRLILVQPNQVYAVEYLVCLYLEQADDLPLDRPELLLIVQSKSFKH